MAWVTQDAPTRAELDACVTCGLCLPVCPTFRLTGDEAASPRGRLTAMLAVDEGDAEVDEAFERVIGFCLGCRACEVVCPSMVPYGRVLEGARAEIAAQRPSLSRRLRHVGVGRLLAMPWLVRLATSLLAVAQRLRLDRVGAGPLRRLRGFRPLPLVPRPTTGSSFPAAGRRAGTAAVLAGCVMDPWFRPVHEATIELLRRGGYDVEVPADQTCCGALAAHDGAAEATRRLAKRNVAAFARYDLVVVDAAGCGAHLKEYGHWADGGAELAGRVVDATEAVARLIDEGRLPELPEGRGPVAIQDPCHLRHAQRIVAEPRAVVRAAGYEPVEIDRAGACCGAAGLYTLLEPEAAHTFGLQKADQIRSSPATLVASANPGCEMQLRSHLGPDFDVRHPVELYAAALLESG